MCTVVCRFAPEEEYAVQMLALRDELATREFDLPGPWWPATPDLIGGRDRVAGGSWCVTAVDAGVTAVVLNRPDKRVADPGAASRGVLPLLAAVHHDGWPDHVQLDGMAAFNLVLATPRSLRWWWFDGASLHEQALTQGTHMFTPRGLADTMDPSLAAGHAELAEIEDGPAESVWPGWLSVVRSTVVSADPAGFVVRVPIVTEAGEANSYETVFGQLIATRPGRLRLDYLTKPADGTDRRWTTTQFTRPLS